MCTICTTANIPRSYEVVFHKFAVQDIRILASSFIRCSGATIFISVGASAIISIDLSLLTWPN